MIGWLRTASLFAPIMSRQSRVDGGGVRIIDTVVHGPNQRRAMHLLSKPWQMFRNRNARQTAGDRIKFTADFGWCFWLHVPHVQVTGTSVQKQHDAVIRFGRERITTRRVQQSSAQQSRQSSRADLQHPAATDFGNEFREFR